MAAGDPPAGGGWTRLLDYCAAGRHAIEGWLQDDALLLTLALHRAQRAAGIAGGVAEIGVHHGKFFVALALLCEGAERALAVDVFADQHLNPDGSGRGDRAVFDANLQRWAVAGRAVVRQQDSLTLTAEQARAALGGGAGARLFSVDGSHALRHATSDLRVAAASLAPGGVVLLDDFLHAGWLGVTEAAVLMLHGEHPPLAPLAICGGKLALVAPADHAAWMQRLAESLPPMAREAERVPFCGFECWRLWLRGGEHLGEGGWALWGHPPLAALDLASPEPARGGTLGAGWSYAEAWGRWTVAERAECAVALPAAGAAAGPPPRRLALQLGTVLAEPGEERRVRVAVGPAGAERPLPPLALREEAMRWHVFDLPSPLPAVGGALPVAVECGPLHSPAALGRCPDPRNLGVSVATVALLA